MTHSNSLTLTVVIPAHNEGQNLANTVQPLTERLKGEKIPYELVIVNDNSEDETADVIIGLMAGDPAIRRIDRRPPRGFGRAVRAGLSEARGDVIVICMADRSDSPEDVVAYYRKIEEGYDCVFGSRFMKGSKCSDYPRLKLAINRIVNKMLQILFWTSCNDLTNSFKAYRSYVIRDIQPLIACHFNITIELSLSALIRGYTIAKLPISWQGRTWGSSKLHLSEMGRRYLSTLLKIWFEKRLILDDIMAESIRNRRDRVAAPSVSLESRLSDLERRLAAMEGRDGHFAG